MSKGNLFLGQARGSVGDVTFTHIDGQQVARARNRSPRNPRVPSQMLQRIVLNSASKAYSLMQAIVDHSFESVNGRARNQQRFMMLNTALLRGRLADVIADPTEANALASEALSFSFKGDFNPQLNNYVLSEGTLPAQVVRAVDTGVNRFQLRISGNVGNMLSYDEVIEAMGIQRGDQLTFLGFGHQYGSEDNSDNIDAFQFARIIMEPASGDFDTNFIDSEEETVGYPNPKNQGFVFLALNNDSDGYYLEFRFPEFSSGEDPFRPSMVGAAVILSRFESGRWRRSPQSVVLADFGGSLPPLDIATFGAAYASYLTGDSSNLYLNGSPVGRAAAPAVPGFTISRIELGGEEYARGSVVSSEKSGTPLSVTGENLTSANIRLTNVDRDERFDPTTYNDTTWEIVTPTPNEMLQLLIGGEVWLTFYAGE